MERRAPSSGAVAAWSALGLFAFYILSPGPVLYIAFSGGGITDPGLPNPVLDALSIVYFPLIVLANEFAPVGDFYLWYFEFLGIGI